MGWNYLYKKIKHLSNLSACQDLQIINKIKLTQKLLTKELFKTTFKKENFWLFYQKLSKTDYIFQISFKIISTW